ncbi:dockerin type I domain-containing protein [Pseudoalteromonas ardens]|uniref:Dockerin domain-containing protein n=1 Tax=Pseudoalteromonas rubra TaxID=43658 RepID=A0A0L0EPN3_9GAMM|nr:dockerin type I domain-containing protein [Pseudoalteromonas sp. R96]KNC66374.1 hypothetical protein AC626_17410 [Pseudoalteromonas rubra]MDK1313431.1 hypothetical protein [Pseudoalteromonas sp. R96]
MKSIIVNPIKYATTRKTPLSLLTQITCKTLFIGMCGLPLLSYAQTPHKVGPAFTVNTYTEDHQSIPVVSKLKDGKFIFAWSSYGQSGEGIWAIYAQRFDATGQPLGGEFRVDSTTLDNHLSPKVTSLEDGSFVIAWLDGSGDNIIYAKRFNDEGTPTGDKFIIHRSSAEYMSDLTIGSLSNGNFVVSWGDKFTESYKDRAKVQVFDTSGNRVGSTITMSKYSRKVSTTGLPDGGFMAVWEGSGYNIYAQRYSATGSAQGAEFLVSEDTNLSHSRPSVSRLSDGDLLFTWQSFAQGNIHARRFDTNGTPKDDSFLVNTFTEDRYSYPAIDALDNGGYVIVSQKVDSARSDDDIFAQVFSATDEKVGEETLVNSITDLRQFIPVVSVTDNNDFVVGWIHQEPSGNYDIRAQRFQLEAVQANTMTITLPQTTVLEGDVVTLPLQAAGADIYGLDAIVSLSDTTQARISGGEYGEFLPSDERLSVPMGINDNQWDGALALMAPATAKSGEGNFATVTLIAEQAGAVNLTLQAQMTDQQGNYLLQGNTDYTFTIEESVALTGNVADLGIAGDFIYVTLTINGQRVTINPDGSFSVRVGLGDVTMSLSAPGHLTAEKQITLAAGQADIDFGQINLVGGDSNGDNLIDIADLTQLLGAYRSVDGQQNGYVMAADFNRDGAINLQDLTLLGAHFGKQGPQSW